MQAISKFKLVEVIGNNKNVMAIFSVIALLLYWPSQNGKFVADLYYYIDSIEQMGFWGFLKSYGIVHQNQVPCLIIYCIYKIAGFAWWLWYLVYSSIHALNAFLFFKLFAGILNLKYRKQQFLGALLFLVSPFQTEAVVWGATLHYLLTLTFLLLCLWQLHLFLIKDATKNLIVCAISFFAALLCFEQAYFFPLLFVVFILIFNEDSTKTRRQISAVLLVSTLLIGCHLLLNKLIYHNWIGHYGAETHSFFKLESLFIAYKNYLYKFIFHFRYLPQGLKSLLNKMDAYHIGVIVSSISTIIIIVYLFLQREQNRLNRVMLFLAISFVLMLLPILNLDNSFTYEVQSDRYGYISSVFFYALFVLILFRLLSKSALVLVMLIVLIYVPITIKENIQWNKAGSISLKLIENFPLKPSSTNYFILNAPDNVNGHYALRVGLEEGLRVIQSAKLDNAIFREVAHVNWRTIEDLVVVENLGDRSFKVSCSSYGKWFYVYGHGAYDYANEYVEVDFDDWNLSYVVKFSEQLKQTSILVAKGSTWEEVAFLE